MAEMNFDPNQDYSTDPKPGEYTAGIVGADFQLSKSSGCEMLVVQFAILEGDFKGSRVRDYFCLGHDTLATRNIAMAKLSKLCKASGIAQLRDSDELLNKVVKVEIKNDSEGRANVKGYKSTFDESPKPVTANTAMNW